MKPTVGNIALYIAACSVDYNYEYCSHTLGHDTVSYTQSATLTFRPRDKQWGLVLVNIVTLAL